MFFSEGRFYHFYGGDPFWPIYAFVMRYDCLND